MMTVCAICAVHPEARAFFRDYGIAPAEESDFLDEVAWRHGLDAEALVRTLNDLVVKEVASLIS